MECLHLWPTPIGIFDMDEEEKSKITEEQLTYLKTLDIRKNTGNWSSVDNYLLKDDKIKPIKDFFIRSLNEYWDAYVCPKNDVKPAITQAWMNYSNPNEFHHEHRHPNSYISGVFYVQSEESDQIVFSRDTYKQIDIPPREDSFNIVNSSSWWMPATQYRLYLFPSSTSHFVKNVTAQSTRMSIAFNTFPVGHVGDNWDLTELII